MPFCLGCEECQLPRREKGRLSLQVGEHTMAPDPAKPIPGIAEVRLTAMHQSMPIAAGRCFDVLADLVRFVKKAVEKPEPREAARRHVEVMDGGKCRLHAQVTELSVTLCIGLAWSQWRQKSRGHQFGNSRRIICDRVHDTSRRALMTRGWPEKSLTVGSNSYSVTSPTRRRASVSWGAPISTIR